MPFHVHSNGKMMVIEQQDVLDDFLSTMTDTDIVIVQNYDYILRSTTVFGQLSGASKFPNKPLLEGKIKNTIAIEHITSNENPI